MKNYFVHFIYSFCIVCLLVFSVISYHNNNVLESRINTITKNNKLLDSDKTFKEDYYITQQSHDTNLLLVVFPIIVGFIALFTYKDLTFLVKKHRTEINGMKIIFYF